MVVVKVRETYDLHTIRNKMSVIAIHTPDPDIIKRNWSGLLVNCKFYRPLSADVTIACASMQSADPLQVGTVEGEIAPEDLFNPILAKACTNETFSILEARILQMVNGNASSSLINTVDGDTASVNRENVSPYEDEFNVYYGLLSDTHGWRHANPQVGISMTGLRPLVHEVLANFGTGTIYSGSENLESPMSRVVVPIANGDGAGKTVVVNPSFMRGNAKPMPRIPTTAYPFVSDSYPVGFPNTEGVVNAQTNVPNLRTVVGAIIIPPSRLHELYYRMVVEWSIEFSEIRPIAEVVSWSGLNNIGANSHYQDYDFGESKVVNHVSSMAAANVDINKVM